MATKANLRTFNFKTDTEKTIKNIASLQAFNNGNSMATVNGFIIYPNETKTLYRGQIIPELELKIEFSSTNRDDNHLQLAYVAIINKKPGETTDIISGVVCKK